MPAAHTFVYLLHIRVDDNDGVVYNHTQGHYERGKGYGVKLYSESVEQSEGYKYGDRDGASGHACHAHGQQKHDNHHHRGNGNEQFFEEIDNRGVNNLALIGDGIDAHVLWQRFLELTQDILYLISKLHDVASLVHLYREHEALLPVVFNVFVGLGILALDGGDVAQTDNVATRVAVHDAVSHVVLGVHLRTQVYGTCRLSVINLSAHQCHALCGEVCQECGRVDAVIRQLVTVYIHANFFALLAANTQVGQFGNGAQAIFQRVHILVQLAISFGFTLQCDEHSRSVAKVIVGY